MVVTAARDIEGVAAAGRKVTEVHLRLVEFLKAGQTLAEIDGFVADTLRAMECTSAFHRYRIPGHPPFPSHSCLSINDCVVHGTHLMTDAPLEPGTILSVDIGVKHRGWIGDAAWTYAIEHGSDEALDLMKCGREALREGVSAIQAGRPLVDWAKAVQAHVEGDCGYWLIRGLGGHGYGRTLHGPPYISNVIPKYAGEWPDQWKLFDPGMLIAVEPMIAIGTAAITTEPRAWPIFTADGSLSVHYEADVMVSEDGPKNLTEGMWELPDVVGI
jgi:methionyl aminopeptidase